MRRKANTIPPLTEGSALQLAREINPEKARLVEFLIMELSSDQGELLNLFRKMRDSLSYEEVIDLMVELKILCSIISDRVARLEHVLDEIVDLAPDLPQK
jgi:hypothetical protein